MSNLTYYDFDAVAWLYNFLLSSGMTVEGVQGLMGNLYEESHCCPYELEGYESQYNYCLNQLLSVIRYQDRTTFETYTYRYGTKKGFGLAQWTWYERKRALWNWGKAWLQNLQPQPAEHWETYVGDMECDANFMIHELQTDYPGVWNTLTTSHDVMTCVKKVLHDYEAPADQSSAVELRRYNYAVKIGQDFGGITPPPTPPTPTPTPTPPEPVDPGHPNIPVWLMFKLKEGSDNLL